LNPDKAAAAYRDLLRWSIDLFPFEPFSKRIWALCNNLTSYDAWYIALAEALEILLATLDRRLARILGPVCRFIVG
jgi:predicted nucleic acid-binding protein